MELARQRQSIGLYTLTYEHEEVWGVDCVRVHADKEFVFMAHNRYSVEGNFRFLWTSDPTLKREEFLEVLLRDTAALQGDSGQYNACRNPRQPTGYMLGFDKAKDEATRTDWSLESAIADPSIITSYDAFPHFMEVGVHTSLATARYTTNAGYFFGPAGLEAEVNKGKTSWVPGEDLVVVSTIREQEITPWIRHFASRTSKHKDFFKIFDQYPEQFFNLLADHS